MEYKYKSINGFDVIVPSNHKIIKIKSEILENFICPISHEQIIRPVSCNNNVYDYEQITQWFWVSNKDPLLGIMQNISQIKLTPLYNIFLLFLCLEKR
jgi:hypothetical protein